MARQPYDIQVSVEAEYIEERSDPEQQNYFFAYTVMITNNGAMGAKLISRHWIISDANGKVEEVRGSGVIGEQPHIEPGRSVQYTSFCPLTTPIGSMRGSYLMRADDGAEFHADIPEFMLKGPVVLH